MTIASGATATFTVALNIVPTANITVTVISAETATATVDVASLTFTPANWNTPQTVTVSGVAAGTVDINLAATGGGYDGEVAKVTVTVN